MVSKLPAKPKAAPESATKKVNAILAAAPKGHRAALQRIREVVRATVPDAIEAISYGLPAFKYKGKPLAGYASYKDHCSYFPMSGKVITKLKKGLTAFRASKGAIHFQPDHPITIPVLKKLLQARLQEIDERG